MFGKLGDIWRQCGDGPGMGSPGPSPGPSPGLSLRLWLSHQQGCVKPETSQRDETWRNVSTWHFRRHFRWTSTACCRIASKSIEVHRSPSNSGIQHVSVHVQTKFVLGASRFCMPSENHNDQSNLEIWVNTRTCKAEAICFPSFPFLHHCKWQIDPNCESPLFNLCWKFVAHEPEQKFDRIPQKTQRCKSETACLPWKRVLLFAQPPLPRFLFLHLSFHLLAREVALIGFWGRSCFSYRVCIFLSAPVWSVALLAVLPEKPSWNSFVALLSVCSLSIIEFWRQCKYWLLIKLAMPSGTCWIWNQPLWSFASQLLHEWAAGGTWRWERQ